MSEFVVSIYSALRKTVGNTSTSRRDELIYQFRVHMVVTNKHRWTLQLALCNVIISIYVIICVYLSIYLSVCLSVCLSIYLSIYLSVYVCCLFYFATVGSFLRLLRCSSSLLKLSPSLVSCSMVTMTPISMYIMVTSMGP